MVHYKSVDFKTMLFILLLTVDPFCSFGQQGKNKRCSLLL